MDFRPTPEQQMIADSVRGQLSQDLSPFKTSGRTLSDPEAAAQILWRRAVELGWLGLSVDEQQGGVGAGMVGLAMFFEEVGRAAAPGPFLANAAVLPSIADVLYPGQDAQRIVQQTIAGEMVFGLGFGDSTSETVSVEHGHFVTDILFICNSAVGAESFDVRIGQKKISCEKKPRFLDVHLALGLADASTLSVPNSFPSSRLVPMRIAMAAECLGIAAQALDDTIAYVKERKQFDRPIGSFQAVKHQIADCYVNIENARTAVYFAGLCVDDDRPDSGIAADMARTFAASIAQDVVQTCIQLHGGFGYTWEGGLHVGLRRIHTLNAYLGSYAASAAALDDAVASGQMEVLF